ncbi:regulatory GntR family protein [Micromonospora palomenae]|uniref:Regulatory GntR family protein n=2 Tax=Micromonospora palomenae TaxID=1461247 RepID=A0A561WFY9_9ACTN|nr:regulatory GntR family protein [Micromonospora palomenae]
MDNRRPPYQQVADALRAAIRDGLYAVGDRLPTVAELAEQYGVAKMTVQRALADLRAEDLIVSWQGRGTFVRSRSGETDAASTTVHDEIMKRLDSMHDELARLDERLRRLEGGPAS